MDEQQLFAWTCDNRRLFAETVDSLGEAHAGDPTLCSAWDVRTLTGHMLQPLLVPSWRFLLTAARVRSMARACDVHAARLSDRPLTEVTRQLRALADEQVTPMYIGAAGPFTDTCIHLRDLAQPQGLDVTVPLAHWHAVLDIIVSKRGTESFVPVKGLLEGLRWEATDTGWTHGEGSSVTGSAESLAMVMSGRAVYLDRIAGEGAVTVRDRLVA